MIIGESRVDWSRFDAVLYDLDGVLTATASVHAAAWKQMFDEFLAARAERTDAELVPFDVDGDYKRYVDGRPRYDGVATFLKSRGIDLPRGDPSDGPHEPTVCGLGNRKNELIQDVLAGEGVEVFEGSVKLVRVLKKGGVRQAIVSSSKNAEAVLRAAGIIDLFEVRVDGVVAARLKLPGKPRPDTFLEAARRLAVEPSRAVVVEDALAGVRAGVNGRFGLVIGVDREGAPEALKEAGADIVVDDLGLLVPSDAGGARQGRA
jgi:beta-phosphoglucomutase family hydrolase